VIPLRDNIPSVRTPGVNYAIIATCVAVYALQATSATHLQEWTFNPHTLASPEAWAKLGLGTIIATLFTSLFLHGSVLHLGFNMLFLWVFGDNVEDRMGHFRYLVFYLLCGALATLTHSLVSLFASVPLLGASGAIAGVLGAYYVLFKGATIRALVPLFIFITVMDIPAVVFLALWFIFQLLAGFGTIGGTGGGVAFWAHIGGFLCGVWLVRLFAAGRSRPPRPRIIDVRYD
jgi:membrane associated rhomboid family serine protease